MKVILTTNIKKLGKIGDLVEVKNGYARNFLFPNNMALRDSKKNLEYYNNIKEEINNIGTECIYVQADLENLEDCRKIVSETDKTFGTVNSLINSAAFTERGTILSTTPENYEKMFNINTKAPF